MFKKNKILISILSIMILIVLGLGLISTDALQIKAEKTVTQDIKSITASADKQDVAYEYWGTHIDKQEEVMGKKRYRIIY